MGNYIIVKRISTYCWKVYFGDDNGDKFENSSADLYNDIEDAKAKAAFLLACNDVDGVLFFDER